MGDRMQAKACGYPGSLPLEGRGRVHKKTPPAGLEPARPAPEAGALSPELRGPSQFYYTKTSLQRQEPQRMGLCEDYL